MIARQTGLDGGSTPPALPNKILKRIIMKAKKITINGVHFLWVNGVMVNLDENIATFTSEDELENDLRVFRKKSVFGEHGVDVVEIEVEND